jgi:hypothetical protein
MKQEQCPKCGRPYLRARNGDPPAECRSCKTSLRPQATEPKPLPPHAFPIAPKRPAPPVGPIGPARGRGGLMLAKVTGLGAVGLLLLTIIVGVVLVVRNPKPGGGVDESDSTSSQMADSGTSSSPSVGGGSAQQPPGTTGSGAPTPPGSMASRWAMSDRVGCAKSVFANTLVGLGDFDATYLTGLSEEESFDRLMAESKANHGEAIQEAAFANLLLKHELLHRSRPLFEIALAPSGPAMKAAVGVWMHAQGSSAALFELDQRGYRLVSESDNIALDEGAIDPELGVIRIPLNLVWNHRELLKIEVPQTVNIDLELRFADGSSARKSHAFDVQPASEVEHLYPWGLGFASIVNEKHPWIADFMACIQNDAKVKATGQMLAGGGRNSCGSLMTNFLLWRELVRRGVVYSNLIGASGDAQRVRQFHEVLGGDRATANCVDGSAVFASLAQAQGMDSYLVLVPGHCFVFIDGLALETTLIGQKFDGREPIQIGDKGEALALDELIEGMLQGESWFGICSPEQAAQFKPFFEEPAFKSFCLAWWLGGKRLGSQIEQAEQAGRIVSDLREQWDALPEGAAKEEKWEELLAARRELNLPNLLNPVHIPLARNLGIKPIPPPANLGPLPK